MRPTSKSVRPAATRVGRIRSLSGRFRMRLCDLAIEVVSRQTSPANSRVDAGRSEVHMAMWKHEMCASEIVPANSEIVPAGAELFRPTSQSCVSASHLFPVDHNASAAGCHFRIVLPLLPVLPVLPVLLFPSRPSLSFPSFPWHARCRDGSHSAAMLRSMVSFVGERCPAWLDSSLAESRGTCAVGNELLPDHQRLSPPLFTSSTVVCVSNRCKLADSDFREPPGHGAQARLSNDLSSPEPGPTCDIPPAPWR